MIVELVGVGTSNKGAELMFHAIVEQVRAMRSDAQFVVDPISGPYAWRSANGLLHLFDPAGSGRMGQVIAKLMHQGYRQRFGLVAPYEVDVALGAEGYAYGDPWKPEWVENAAARYEQRKKLGQTIILLPQAFGPFENQRVRKATIRIVRSAKLVYARDQQSFDFLREITDIEHLKLAPDFTNLLKGKVPDGWGRENGVAVVPNQKMISHSNNGRDVYVELMAKAIDEVQSTGFNPFLLVHETASDEKLAVVLKNRCSKEIEIVSNPDPLELKGILGSCVYTIGSRFHGLVSALSQGIPSIGTSWSHKYHYLFRDYCVEDLLAGDSEAASMLTKLLADPIKRNRYAMRISSRSNSLMQASTSMWREVRTLFEDK
ncbi:polysaccharide pyruvyl transferase family protein [Verrucomicrobiales bacterium]|nr:polysaccharide pyruvyl transferase family protein [Verrucomicrobiales bacterium]